MEKQKKAAGKTATKTLVIIKDCHVNHNKTINNADSYMERFVRALANKNGWIVAEKQPKAANATRDTCKHESVWLSGDGKLHSHCDLLNLYTPEDGLHTQCNFYNN